MTEQAQADADAIQIRIASIAQLFHSLDPAPFHEKDLDKDAEQFIVSWARELPRDRPLKVVVHLPEAQLALAEAQAIAPAVGQFCAYRAQVIGLELKELFRSGAARSPSASRSSSFASSPVGRWRSNSNRVR